MGKLVRMRFVASLLFISYRLVMVVAAGRKGPIMTLVHGALYTMVGEMIPDGYLTIEQGRITKIGPMKEFVAEAVVGEVIDLGGRKVYPGFIDAHTHLGMSEDGVGDEGEDINEMSDPCTPQVRVIDAIDPLGQSLGEALRAGVTTMIVSPGSANPISGQIAALKTFGRRVDQMVIAAPFAMKFALGENPKRVYGAQEQAPMSRMATAAIIRENLAKALHYQEEQLRAVENEDSPPDLDFKSEALLPLLRREMKAHFHAHRAYDMLTAIRIAKEFGLDYVLIHGTEGHRIADILAEEQVKMVCGPVIGTRSKPELSRMTLDNCSLLVAAGIEVAICSDHPEVPGELLPLSAALAASHGMGENQALLSITYWAAKAVGLEHRIGSLAVGMDGDLVVYSGSPLEVQNRPDLVFVEGQQVPQ